ncbi:MAG: phage scaffolding protein [Firmicutes bacterium]|nr:phage scaffolding protein [Bacillota bacterium]
MNSENEINAGTDGENAAAAEASGHAEPGGADCGNDAPGERDKTAGEPEDAAAKIARLEAELGRIKAALTELGGEFTAAADGRIYALVGKLVAEKEAAREENARLRVEFAVADALRAAGARNGKVVEALLDIKRIGVDVDGNVQGLETQIKALRRSDPYLFEGGAAGTGNARSLGRTLKGGEAESLGKRLGALAGKRGR